MKWRGQNGGGPLYRYSAAGLEPVDRTSLAAEKIRERQGLQHALQPRIGVLADDLLVVAEEYGLVGARLAGATSSRCTGPGQLCSDIRAELLPS